MTIPPLPVSSQASNAAADWAQKRKQALERATELRAQRKAAERASVQAVSTPVRGFENDPLPLPKPEVSHHDVSHDGRSAGGAAPEGNASPGGRRRAQWGEPTVPAGANRLRTKENRDPRTPPRADDESRLVGAGGGRLMPWEQEILVKQATEEATLKGLPPTPSKEVIARVFGDFGEARDGDDPEVWGPPSARPSPTRNASSRAFASPAKRPASAAPRSPSGATRLVASVTVAPPITVATATAPARTKPSVQAAALMVRESRGESGGSSASAQPPQSTQTTSPRTTIRPATARAQVPRKFPYAPAAVPGFTAAYRKQTATLSIKTAAPASARLQKADTPAVRDAHAAIAGALTPPGALRERDGEKRAAASGTVDITSTQDAGDVAALLGAFARRASAMTRGEIDVNDKFKSPKRQSAATQQNAAGRQSTSVVAPVAGASVTNSDKLTTDVSRGADQPPGVAPRSASKKPRLPTEVVSKIVSKAVEQRLVEKRGGSPVHSPKAKQVPTARRAPVSPNASWSAVPGSPVSHAPAAKQIGFDEFLKLQEQTEAEPGVLRKSPRKQTSLATKPPFQTDHLVSELDPSAAAEAKQKIAAAKAPKKPTAATAPEDFVVAKKSPEKGNAEKSTRQMFDKRESRRMNAKPFAAAVQRWRRALVTSTEAEGTKGQILGTKKTTTRPSSPPGDFKVFVRKRPLFAHEQGRGEFDCVTVPGGSRTTTSSTGQTSKSAVNHESTPTKIVIHNCQMRADLKRMFVKHSSFDVTRAFGETATSEEVYQTAAAPMVVGALCGKVGALFMYGQTGSGKTHTMEHLERTAMGALFAGVNQRSDCDSGGNAKSGNAKTGTKQVPGALSVRVAYFEIAGKKCTDLLSPSRNEISLKEVGGGVMRNGAHELAPEEYRKLDVQLIGAVEPTVTSATELEQIVAAGKQRRATSATHCNAASSRSHAVLRLTCVLADGATGRLTLVDCAGSERKEDNVYHSAEQRKETAEINASLYALKECVRMRKMQQRRLVSVADGGAVSGGGGGHVHVPYRSSHLTRVLMECFVRPDAQLGVIGTVSPASTDTEHSMSTLKTVGLIGGCDDGDGVFEVKEDVSRHLKIEVDGRVTETAVERVVAPVRWSNAHIRAFMQRVGNEKFAGVTVPLSLVGRDVVRMSPLALQKICGGDKKLAEALHDKIRDEIQKCSSKTK